MTDKIRIGQSNPRREHIEELHQAWREKRLVLVLGAGLSIPYGIPSWKDLVMELLLENEPNLDRFWLEYKRPLADWMSKAFDFDLLALSRVVKYNIASANDEPQEQTNEEFKESVRKKLYAARKEPAEPTALQKLAQLIASADSREGVAAIVTMNFDDLLEQELTRENVAHHSVVDADSQPRTGIAVIHPHGFLPYTGQLPLGGLVFSEDEYHKLVHSPFHWAVSEMLTRLRRNTTLFLGLSMADQTLRRLLDETARRDEHGRTLKPYRRYVLRRDYTPPPENQMQQAGMQIESEATILRTKSGNMDHTKPATAMDDAITKMTEIAHTFDRRLFKDMGVGTVWFKEYDDIPRILEAIAKGIDTGPQ